MVEKKTRTVGVILAAGKGERMRRGLPKQFLPLGGKPLFLHSVALFCASSLIDEVCLVIPRDRESDLCEWLAPYEKEKPMHCVVGGVTRALSSYNAYAYYRACGERVNFVIHDAARPLLARQDLEAVTEALCSAPAAVLAIPTPDTIYEVDEGDTITNIPSRSSLWCAQTPQAFRAEVLERMYAARPEEALVTDDVGLMRSLCPELPIRLIEATAPNPKLTTPKDLPWLEYLLGTH